MFLYVDLAKARAMAADPGQLGLFGGGQTHEVHVRGTVRHTEHGAVTVAPHQRTVAVVAPAAPAAPLDPFRERVESYDVDGPRYDIPNHWGLDIFVRRGTMRGRPWLHFAPKGQDPARGYYVTGHKTLTEAVNYGRTADKQIPVPPARKPPAPAPAAPTREDMKKELAEVEEKIASEYWRFSRTSSPTVGPPSGALYERKAELRRLLGFPTPAQKREADVAKLSKDVEAMIRSPDRGAQKQQIREGLNALDHLGTKRGIHAAGLLAHTECQRLVSLNEQMNEAEEDAAQPTTITTPEPPQPSAPPMAAAPFKPPKRLQKLVDATAAAVDDKDAFWTARMKLRDAAYKANQDFRSANPGAERDAAFAAEAWLDEQRHVLEEKHDQAMKWRRFSRKLHPSIAPAVKAAEFRDRADTAEWNDVPADLQDEAKRWQSAHQLGMSAAARLRERALAGETSGPGWTADLTEAEAGLINMQRIEDGSLSPQSKHLEHLYMAARAVGKGATGEFGDVKLREARAALGLPYVPAAA